FGAEPSLNLDDSAADRDWSDSTATYIRGLKTRAASSLINVAFVGQFSSGKSFLIGGLQRKLAYESVIGADDMPPDQDLGLLYSAGRHTTACPVTVVPVSDESEYDASGRGFLRVKFIGSEQWEPIGNSVPPAVVAAYTTQHPEHVINRLTH